MDEVLDLANFWNNSFLCTKILLLHRLLKGWKTSVLKVFYSSLRYVLHEYLIYNSTPLEEKPSEAQGIASNNYIVFFFRTFKVLIEEVKKREHYTNVKSLLKEIDKNGNLLSVAIESKNAEVAIK